MSAEHITEAVRAYRAEPGEAQLAELGRVFRDSTLYVPVGDFDGRNAAIPTLHAAEGGEFIPVYTDAFLVPGGEESEGIRPADWRHILDQLPHVAGYAVNPHTLNFAFTRDFIDVLLPGDGAPSDGVPGDAGAGGSAERGEAGNASATSEAQEAAGGEGAAGAQSTEGTGGAGASAPSTLAAEETPEGTYFQIGVPAAVPSSLREAMQAVANRTGHDVWLLLAVPSHGEESYLMVIDGPEDWFATRGAGEINGVLGTFPDPGRPLDFVTRASELGQFVEGKEPHYRPATSAEAGVGAPAAEGASAGQQAGHASSEGRTIAGMDTAKLAERAQDYASRAKDVGGHVAGQARERASEFGAQMKDRFEEAHANSDNPRGFLRRFFGRE